MSNTSYSRSFALGVLLNAAMESMIDEWREDEAPADLRAAWAEAKRRRESSTLHRELPSPDPKDLTSEDWSYANVPRFIARTKLLEQFNPFDEATLRQIHEDISRDCDVNGGWWPFVRTAWERLYHYDLEVEVTDVRYLAHLVTGVEFGTRAYDVLEESAFGIVARFGDAESAADAARELTAFFALHAKQVDEQRGLDGDVSGRRSEAATGLGAKHGLKRVMALHWGDGTRALTGDEPYVSAVGDNLLVFHHLFCAHHLDTAEEDFRRYFDARGADIVAAGPDEPKISALFRLPADAGRARALEDELAGLFEYASDPEHASYDGDLITWVSWYSSVSPEADFAFFSDGKTIGFYLPTSSILNTIDRVKTYLAEHGVEGARLRLCEPRDRDTFRAIAGRNCEMCGGALECFDSLSHGIDQLVCRSCGGMFDVATLLAQAKDVLRSLGSRNTDPLGARKA